MKIIIAFFLTIMTLNIFSQIVYVDNFDAVYPATNIGVEKSYLFDLNKDGANDIKLDLIRLVCIGTTISGGSNGALFTGVLNIYGQNKVNANVDANALGIDSSNDTLNVTSLWNNSSLIYNVLLSKFEYCKNIGFGSHKQGFRLLKTNPNTGALGYIYGYIDYSLTSNVDIIIHGWYYESSFNVPIVANSKLDYPYDGNCIHIDTIKVFDTITTFIAVKDTLVISLNIPNSSGDLKLNTIKVYPNPASSHIYVDMGTHTLLNNYEIQILNNLGHPVFFSPIDKKEYYINLNTFGGKGIYFLRIKNSLGITIETKKIVLQ